MPTFSLRDGSSLVSIDEAAVLLGVSKRTAQRFVERRAIPFYRVARLVRFDVRDLEQYLSGRRVEEVGSP